MKVKRTKAELEASLREQLDLLVSDCQVFDSGLVAAAKSIALRLRVLLHDKGQSKSLLGQLDLRFRPYLDTGQQRRKRRGIKPTGSYLAVVRIANKDGVHLASFIPRLSDGPEPLRSSSFERWWNDSVIVAGAIHFHRREVILHVADTDGGAHVDAAIDHQYLGMKRGEFLNVWACGDAVYFGTPPREDCIPLLNLEAAVIRQIAHEVLLTLKRVHADLVSGYAA